MRLLNWAALSVVAGMSSCSLAVATAPVTTLSAPHAAKAGIVSAQVAVVSRAATADARRA